jgi:hypothetical protein
VSVKILKILDIEETVLRYLNMPQVWCKHKVLSSIPTMAERRKKCIFKQDKGILVVL